MITKTILDIPRASWNGMPNSMPSYRLPVGEFDSITIDLEVASVASQTNWNGFYQMAVYRVNTEGDTFKIFDTGCMYSQLKKSISIGPGLDIPVSFGSLIEVREQIYGAYTVDRGLHVVGKGH